MGKTIIKDGKEIRVAFPIISPDAEAAMTKFLDEVIFTAENEFMSRIDMLEGWSIKIDKYMKRLERLEEKMAALEAALTSVSDE